MSEPAVIHLSDGRAIRTTRNGDRITVRRRSGEADVDFDTRLRWGRFDELVMDFCDDGDLKLDVSTLDQYRTDFNTLLLPRLGDRWLVDCGDDAYDLLLGITDAKSYASYNRAHRTLGSLISWAQRKKRWPTHIAAFGGNDYRRSVHKAKMRSRPVIADHRRGGLITVDDCPTWADTRSFADALGDAAARKWGEQARPLGELPLVQYATGTRIATTFAFNSSQLRTDRFHIQWQIDRKATWTIPDDEALAAGWQPPLKLIKQRHPKGHDAHLWPAVVNDMATFAAEAAEERAGWFFATLIPGSRNPLAAYEDLEKQVRDETRYRWTSHAHRHAYASWNLAPRCDGGWGYSPRTVADWLGDGVELVTRTYWHSTGEADDDWSNHLPGTQS